MAQVTRTNLFSEARANVLSLIANSSNVPDPTIGSSEFRKWIYSRTPDVKADDFKGYPFIVINHADVDFDNEGGRTTVDGKSKRVFWDIEIEIATSDRGGGKLDGIGAAQMDTLSNSILSTLLDIINRRTLSNQSMKFLSPTTTKVVSEVIENELTFNRSILIGFKSKIQVSA